MFRNGFIFRLIGVLLLLGLVAAGGYFAYKAGLAQGIAQAPEVAEAIREGAPVPPMYDYRPYGLGYPYHFGFFPFGGICLSIFFLFLFLGLLRMVFCPWRHSKQNWNRKWEGGAPPMFEEWHKRAHGEAEKKE